MTAAASDRVEPARSLAGLAFIIAAPSGAGKTSLVRGLLERVDGLELSVSHTTRAPRPGEIDGVHYHFVDRARFETLIADDDMLEYASVHGNLYGTSRRFVLERMAGGADVVLEIDWQGARIARERLHDTTSTMIVPPSRAALAARLKARGQDTADVIARRLAAAGEELSHVGEFDYVVVNDAFDQALVELCSIVRAQRLRAHRQQARHQAMLAELIGDSPAVTRR